MLVAPPAGHAPRRERGHSEGEHLDRRRGLHRATEAEPCARNRPMPATGGRGHRGWLQAAAGTTDRDRVCQSEQGEGRRRGYPRVCREPAAVAVRCSLRTETGHGHRPWLPHGLQGGVSRRAGQPAAPRGHLPPPSREPHHAGENACQADAQRLPDRGHRHRQRHGQP